MALNLYNKKRKFDETPEPKGVLGKRGKSLRFVVQKHDASHLHYDFRLEIGGVMKSWAIPKGPSLNPSDKRLAVMTEDHPISYNSFEGHIPEGHYGGGDVIVWDTGTYHGETTEDAKESEKEFEQGLKKGALTFYMEGAKLRGLFTLVRFKGQDKQWILIKKRDAFATDEEVTLDNRSVLSKKTLIGKTEDAARYGHKKKTFPSRVILSSEPESMKNKKNGSRTKSGKMRTRQKRIPKIKPMLATLTDAPFDNDDWLFEIKWDGYRAIADIHDGKVALYSRNGNSFNDAYPEIVDALAESSGTIVIDGEIIAYDKNNKATFQSLQNSQEKLHRNSKNKKDTRLEYMVFDIVYKDGASLMDLPLIERKKILQEVLPESPLVSYSDHIIGRGKEYFKLAEKEDLEGIMAKKMDSPYVQDRRTEYWLKIKHHKTDEALICGFTEPKGSREHFGALVLGQYKNNVLTFIGHTGTGFNDKILKDLYGKMKKLETEKNPFGKKVPINAPVTWIKPKLVAAIKFGEWTEDGIMRQPVYQGLRSDKSPASVTGEKTVSKDTVIEDTMTAKKSKPTTWKKASKETSGYGAVEISNPDKIYFPKTGMTKGDMIAYYDKIAPYILPYLKDRPESLLRHPNGAGKPGFFQKNFTAETPEFVEKIKVHSDSTSEDVNYLLCQNKETLLYMANLGTIEINPWSSRVGSLAKADYLVIDLDPDDANTWPEIVQTAKEVKKVLDMSCEKGYIKTSGKTGLHIFVPLGAKYEFEQVRTFAELLATMVHNALPEFTSLERSPKNRKGKIYIDYLQNSEGQTLAAPYSLRPVEDATVSTPFEWSELSAKRDLRKTDTKEIFKRLEKYGDIWKPMLKDKVDLKKAIVCLQKESNKKYP